MKRALDLRLLEHHIRIESPLDPLLADLALCFSHHSPRHPVSPPPVDLQVTVQPSCGRTGEIRVTSRPKQALAQKGELRTRHTLAIASKLSLWAVAQSRSFYVFHAGAVARDGQAILLPAASGSGKTTLTTALLREGYSLISDEVSACDFKTSDITPYPRALWLRPGSLQALGLPHDLGAQLTGDPLRIVQASELGAIHTTSRQTPVLVVFPSYQPGAATHVEELRAGPAALELMRYACSQAHFKERGLDFVIALAQRLPCYRLTYSKLVEALEVIEDLFVAPRGVV